MVARTRGKEGKGSGSYCLMSTEFQCGKTKSVLEVDDGDDCQTMNIFNAAHVCK